MRKKKKPVDLPSTVHLSSADGSLDLVCERFGGVSADMFDEVPLSRAIAILETCAQLRQNPPHSAVRCWTDHMGRADIIDCIRAVAVENSSGTRYRRDNLSNKFQRAERLLRSIDVPLFCDLEVVAGHARIRTSHALVGAGRKRKQPISHVKRDAKDRNDAAADRHFRGPYRYLGLKSSLRAYLPLLMDALEQKDAPVYPFFW